MKYVITILFQIAMLGGFAQKTFEGIIEYEIRLPEEKEFGKLILSFGVNKIRINLIESGKGFDNYYAIINLDSGIVYTVSVKNKSFETRVLPKNSLAPPTSIKEIAGYHTTPVIIHRDNRESREGFLVSTNNARLHIANDLYYPISELYQDDATMIMIKNGRIVLGAEFILSQRQWNLNKTIGWGKQNENIATIMATSILPLKTDVHLFELPEGYMEVGKKDLATDIESSLKDSIDSVIKIVTIPLSENKKKTPQKTKSIPSKSPALHRKKD